MVWIKVNGNRVNGNMKDFFNGTHTEIPLANFEMSLLGLSFNLINHNLKFAADGQRWERNYLTLAEE